MNATWIVTVFEVIDTTMERLEHTQGALMMVLEELGGNDGDGEHLGVGHRSQDMAVVVQAEHGCIDNLEDSYNPGGVHWLLLRQVPVEQPGSCQGGPMNVN